MYSSGSDLELVSSSNNMNSFQTWNQHNDYYPRNGSFHQHNPYFIQKPNDDNIVLEKFQYDTLVKLETGETKNIQQLTTNDFLISTKQSQQYSSLFARVEYIGCVDKYTGKVELRFYINEIQKMISYYVQQEMPFFVHQYSCWSSISPEYTRRICGLNCRQLECGDIIMAITEHPTISSQKYIKPDYTQQSPTKCLVERYMNEKISSSKDNIILKKQIFSNTK
ncbi:unnamed protein product [Adineta steineri]|uniref:AXH domain-containing protein n=1 Tax=Adineta steineri TaxID=433720 RepID=A0A815Z4M6_9BILA|nr:unnamed protein product [Adineta steineri]CAF1310015.1 unnamed protein product [Adineta steineri]CAF1551841.1 unnamed protein product [Adineta steineri]CAF1579569.1 unnamed protein product [Adineta steineri]